MATKIDELFYDVELRTKDMVREAQRARKAIAQLDDSGGAAAASMDKMDKESREAAKGVRETGKESKKTSGILGSMKRKVAALITTWLGFQSVRALLRKVTKDVGAFDRSMNQVATLTDLTGSRFESLKRQVAGLSRTMPKDESDLGLGLYQVLSSGVQDASDALVVLDKSAKLATAGLINTETSVDAVTTVMNAYGLEAGQAGDVTDTFFNTVKEGKIVVGELAQSIGQVATTASLAGVDMDQLGAAIATMTKLGIKAPQTMTSLSRFLLTIIQPTEEVTEKAKEMGIEWSAAALRAKGLKGFMQDLLRATDGNIEKLAELNPNIRAARAAFVLAGSGAEEFDRILETFANKQGATEEAVGKVTRGFGEMATIIKNRLSIRLRELADGPLLRVANLIEQMSRFLLPDFQRRLLRLEELGVDRDFLEGLRRGEAIRQLNEDLDGTIERMETMLAEGGFGPSLSNQIREAIRVAEERGGELSQATAKLMRGALESAREESLSELEKIEQDYQDTLRELEGIVGREVAANISESTASLGRGGFQELLTGIADDQARQLAINLRGIQRQREEVEETAEARAEMLRLLEENLQTQEELFQVQTSVAKSSGEQETAAEGTRDAIQDLKDSLPGVRGEMELIGEQLALGLDMKVSPRLDLEDVEAFRTELQQRLGGVLGQGTFGGSAQEIVSLEREITTAIGSGNDEMRERGEEILDLLQGYMALTDAMSDVREAEGKLQDAQELGAEDEARKAASDLEKALIDLFEAYRDVRQSAEDANDEMKELAEIAGELEDAARGVLRLAEAFGSLDDQTRKALEGAIDLASAVGSIASSGFSVGAVIQGIGGLVSLGAGLFGGGDRRAQEIEQRKRQIQVMIDLQRAIERLTSEVQTGSGVSPSELRSGLDALKEIIFQVTQNQSQGALGIGGINLVSGDQVARLFQQNPELLRELRRIEEETGIRFIEGLLDGLVTDEDIRRLEAAQEAMRHIGENLGRFNLETVAGQMERFNLLVNQFDIDDPIKQMELFLKTVGSLAPALRGAMKDFDLSTAEGRQAASDFVASIANELASKGVTKRIESLFGEGITPGEVLDILNQMDRLLDQATEGGAEGRQAVVRDVQITEARAGRLLAINTTIASRTEELVDLAIARNNLLASMGGTAGAGATGSSGGGSVAVGGDRPILIDRLEVPIHFPEGPEGGRPTIGEAREFGERIGSGIIEGMDRELAQRELRAQRTQGKV